MQGSDPDPRFFACTGCGACCRWTGHVLLEDGDITRLASALELSEEGFIQQYCGLARNRAQLCLLDRADGACVFLAGDRCRVYAVRPEQCRAFPFPWTTPEECPGLSRP